MYWDMLLPVKLWIVAEVIHVKSSSHHGVSLVDESLESRECALEALTLYDFLPKSDDLLIRYLGLAPQ